MSEEKKTPDDPIIGGPPPAVSTPPAPIAEPTPKGKTPEVKPGPGRPKKNETRPEKPEPAPKPRKPDEEIRDPRGAIERAIESLNTHMRGYQIAHPESDLAWVWKKLRSVCPEEKGRIGAPIDESAFTPIVKGPIRGIEMLGDLPEEEKATPEEIKDVTDSWARASTHLGLSERMAAIGSAVSKSVGLLGRQVTRTVTNMLATPEPQPETPIEAPAFEAPAEGEKKESDR